MKSRCFPFSYSKFREMSPFSVSRKIYGASELSRRIRGSVGELSLISNNLKKNYTECSMFQVISKCHIFESICLQSVFVVLHH